MEVEDVTRESLAAGRSAQQQRELPVRVRVLREVVVHDDRVLPVVEEVLAHRAAGERSHPLDRRRLLRGGGDDRRVLHRALVAELLVHLRNRRRFLADRDVDADDVRVLLVEDRVDQDRGLARLAVADDQLPLTAADIGHRVDRLDAGLQRLLYRLACDHARRFELQQAGFGRVDRAAAVERVPERVDDAAEQGVADRDARDLASAPHRLPLLHVLPLAEERGTDVVLLEIEREAHDAVLELEHLHRDCVLEPVRAGDAVTDLENGADLGEVGLDVVVLDPFLQDRGDLFRAQLHAYLPLTSS